MAGKMMAGFFLGAAIIMGCASGRQASEGTAGTGFPLSGASFQSDGIFAYRAGQFEVFMLVESERDGNTAIIPDASQATLEALIPPAGFKHTTNAFLIKAPGRNILIDAGTGLDGIIVGKIKLIGLEPGQINSVLMTHLHRDHFGGLESNGAPTFPNATLYLSARELEHFTKTSPNQGAIDALAQYSGRIETFEPGAIGPALETLLPGLSPIAIYGHTPGHTAFMIESGPSKLIIAGDFLHLALVQFAHPEISATFDIDKQAAAASRRQILNYAAQNQIPIGGMHIVYPGIGTVEASGNGFKFSPLH
jgi:glyoxylase-like metal-dependent hydrolase (beta-lactamase superfamily II)